MKRFLKYIMTCMGCIGLAACSQEEWVEQELEKKPAREVTITVQMPGNETESRLDLQDNSTLTWTGNDDLYVLGYDGETYKGCQTFTITSGYSTKIATFKGNLVEGATRYKIYLKGLGKIDPNGNYLTDYSNQIVESNVIGHAISAIDMSTAEKISETELEKGKFELKINNAIFGFRIESLPKDMGNVRYIMWTANAGSKNEKKLTSEVLYRDLGQLPAEVFMNFYPEDMNLMQGGKISLTLYGENKDYEFSKTVTNGLTYEPGKLYWGKVSTTETGKGYFTQYKEAIAEQPTNMIWVNRESPTAPPAVDAYDLTGRDMGSYYWTYRSKDQAPIVNVTGHAFNRMEFVEVLFPTTTLTLGEGCCQGAYLHEIVLPRHLKTIGASAFCDCLFVKSKVEIPNSVTSIGDYAFKGCLQVPSFIMQREADLTKIGSYAFEECEELRNFTIPAKVTTLGDGILNQTRNGITVKVYAPKGTLQENVKAFEGMNTTYSDLYLDLSYKGSISGKVWMGMTWRNIYYLDSENNIEIEDAPGYEGGF